METIKLGRTGLHASVLGLGGGGDSRLGRGTGADEAQSIRLVRSAIDQGVNFIDTAEAYGTEELVGRALRELPRDRVILSTKKTTREGAVTPQTLVDSLEQSLRRLHTDYVDIYHLHAVQPSNYEALRDALVPTLHKLRDQGKIRFLGITEAFHADPQHQMLQQALDDDLWDVVMVGFNLLNQSARRTVFARTLERDVGTLIMFAVRRALSRPARLRELLEELAARGKVPPSLVEEGLTFLLREDGASSLPDAAYRFCRAEPGAHVILSGTSSIDHLRENVTSIARPPLQERDRARLIELFGAVDDVTGQ